MIALKKHFIALNLILIIIISACNIDDLITDAENSNITAKSKINEVLSTAKSNFANDAQLSAIYGLNVSTKGEIDLLKPDKNAFVYVVQSDSAQSNEFYVPVFGSTPIRSPINFTSMLLLVEDQTAKDILGNVFGTLSTVHIGSSVNYDDSPAIITTILNRSDVQVFRSANSGSKMDIFLIPSKSIDTTNVSNSADWIVNFYSETTSLVLWLHPGTVNGTVTKISD
jgi:hypothetical protein